MLGGKTVVDGKNSAASVMALEAVADHPSASLEPNEDIALLADGPIEPRMNSVDFEAVRPCNVLRHTTSGYEDLAALLSELVDVSLPDRLPWG
jgi:hypothetical protein